MAIIVVIIMNQQLLDLPVSNLKVQHPITFYFKYTNNMLPWYFSKQNKKHNFIKQNENHICSIFYLKVNINTYDHNT